ncbi:hypothetical protein NIES2135_09570 [Leptolyngbya boryana NIES-2135]|uniref:Uncharacterized protein n=1 Tax=Leptolyngbya boryana NIES-2135 TaxID=1973484 RepID=A0A1Z4JBR8_LEPBY|nr:MULTISPECIES: hypothetical protein [Leptolyngbya]BAY54143.1 hypothetical protein NIES2135_09570 [Leptolyngbya boryana NIES-2135]MBD2371022.1 hypothetical protein [Leptolyngbya sp. FACHB-161]MBD2377520.1 hypothetical protein [Leptolyngbya sp. FACHB-238]MBD2401928.1 hypothetical protein [Leptolyngbya sp. FACHB-239]MBD2408446.1 hypothetical protein [Leptolyngbya sp. FACHB-402]
MPQAHGLHIPLQDNKVPAHTLGAAKLFAEFLPRDWRPQRDWHTVHFEYDVLANLYVFTSLN